MEILVMVLWYMNIKGREQNLLMDEFRVLRDSNGCEVNNGILGVIL